MQKRYPGRSRLKVSALGLVCMGLSQIQQSLETVKITG